MSPLLLETVEEEMRQKRPEPKYSVCATLDVWPPRDWWRFKLDRWNPGRYFQLCVGPIRIDVFEN